MKPTAKARASRLVARHRSRLTRSLRLLARAEERLGRLAGLVEAGR